jgi:UDP-MurNAc hydroxylase
VRLTFYSNACAVVESEGFRVLNDPWLVDGAFEGAWQHCPPLKTRPQDLADVDALFVSHLHPDHCDPETLKVFRRDIPIIVLDHGPNFLHRVLGQMGFTDLVKIRDGETGRVGPFEVTLYAPFATHIFHESTIGNLIDCAAIFEAGGFSVFNFNDNTPDVASARRLRERHGRPTVAQVAYNAAGPYPSCFHNLSDAEKAAAADRVLTRNFDHAAAISAALEPRWHMPFAGAFVIGGSQWRKNAVLGTAPPDVAAERIAAINPDIPVLLLNEGQSVDLATGARSAPYEPWRQDLADAYIRDVLAPRPYPHEADPMPDRSALLAGCEAARARLWDKQQRFDFFPDLRVLMEVGDGLFAFHLQRSETELLTAIPETAGPRIQVRMDERMLQRIVDGRAHWNNAEGGMHIDFVREPDVYVRDFHTMMAFFAA